MMGGLKPLSSAAVVLVMPAALGGCLFLLRHLPTRLALSLSTPRQRLVGEEPGWAFAYRRPAPWGGLRPYLVALLALVALSALVGHYAQDLIDASPRHQWRLTPTTALLDVPVLLLATAYLGWSYLLSEHLGPRAVLRGQVLSTGRREGGAAVLRMTTAMGRGERELAVDDAVLATVRPGQDLVVEALEADGATRVLAVLVRVAVPAP